MIAHKVTLSQVKTARAGLQPKIPPFTEEECLLEYAERHLHSFVEQAWHVVEPAHPFVDGWHIRAICEHLEAVTKGQIRNLIINVPPRHTKSTLVSVMWPAWEWISNATTRWVYFSYASGLSIRDSVRCRYVIQSYWYQQRWGNRFQLTSDQNAKERFENNRRGFRLASSIGGQGTGEGGDRLVIDDPHNVKTIESDVIRQGVLDWADHVLPTRRNDPKRSALVAIMQRSHENDFVGHYKEQGYDCEYLVLPAEFEESTRCSTSIGFIDPRIEEGQLIWSERFGKPEVDALKRELGSYASAAQLQQRPSPAGGGIFKRAWFEPYMYYARPERFDSIYQSWDMAFKDLKSSDYVSGGIWGICGADVYLLDRVNEQLNFVKTCAAVERLGIRAVQFGAPASHAKYVEDKANGPAVINYLHDKVPGMIAVTPEGSKISRANAVSPMCEAGNVHLPHPSIAPWVDEYLGEMCAFPMAAHDDDVDMTTQALLKASDSRHVELPPIVSITKESPWGDGLITPRKGSDRKESPVEDLVGGLYRSSHV